MTKPSVLRFALALSSLAFAIPAAQDIGQAPLYFEPNQGQFDSRVRFLGRGMKYRIWITDSEFLIDAPKQAPVRMRFGPQAAGPPRKAEGLDKQIGISNYFIGADPKKWTHNVPSFSRVKLHDVYPGVDVVFYANEKTHEIEYDLIVKPGADASQISILFDPSRKVHQNNLGEVLVEMAGGATLRHRVPVVHQDGVPVKHRARLDGHTLRFEIANYDEKQSLLIDPTIVYSSYLGGGGRDLGQAIAVDSVGAMYVTGFTESLNFPTGNFTPVGVLRGTRDAFVTKIGASPVNGVHPRIYSAYIGGSMDEIANSIAVDAAGAAYVAGETASSDFPVSNGFQSIFGAGLRDGFLVKISATGTFALVYGTFAGGSGDDVVNGVAVDSAGAAYVAGTTGSSNLAVRNAHQSAIGPGTDAFVWKIAGSPNQQGLYDMVYGTYFGGAGRDKGNGVAVDSAGNAYLAGSADAGLFPAIASQKTAVTGFSDAFVAKLSAVPGAGGRYEAVYSVLIGGSGDDVARKVAVDSAGAAYVTGYTGSTDFPLVLSTLKQSTSFITKIAAQPSGSPTSYRFAYSMHLPTSDSGGVAVDPTGAAYVVGSGGGYVIDQAPPSSDSYGATTVTKIAANPSGVPLIQPFVYVTRLGPANTFGNYIGIAIDSTGAAYVAGTSTWLLMPLVNGDSAAMNSGENIFLTKLSARVSSVSISAGLNANVTLTVTGPTVCLPGTFYRLPVSFDWPPGTSCGVVVVPLGPGGDQDRFTSWSDTGLSDPSRTIQAGTNPQWININYDRYFRVITGVSQPGTGTVNPAVDDYFKEGTVMTFNAVPAAGYGFVRWDGGGLQGLSPIVTVTLGGVTVGNATFERPTVNTSALQFVPVTPCRLYDSRTPGQTSAFARFQLGVVVTGNCGIPSDVVALSLNVTVVPRGPLGYLTVWPTGQPQTLTSTLNALDGRIKANAVIVPIGINGRVNFYATDTTEVIVDVNGYFVTPQAGSLAFYPLPPCRILDTRLANGALGGPSLAPVASRTIPVLSSACNIPPSAKAYSMNATVVPPGPLGFLTLWPTGVAQPVVSTLNDLPGTVVANAAIVPAGTGGSIEAFATDRTHLIMDINGYFAPPGQPGGLNYFVITPCRLLDTRDANAPFGGPALLAGATRSFAVPSGACGIPSAARAYSLNATVVPSAPFGYLTLWPTGMNQPLVSTLNAIDGALASNAAIVPAGTAGAVSAFVSDLVHLLFDVNGYFLP